MIGDRLGNWMIYSELGRGGMGRVYLAQEEMTGRTGAIKILTAELAQEAGFLARFQQEIETLHKLDHPNIVRFYESGSEGGVYFYAMEFVDGESVEHILARERRLPWRSVIDIALQICPALKHAHDHGIIHRDLKPANLLRSVAGVIKLSDFGIAKVFAGQHLTATGSIVGTAEYISPEQAAGKPVTKRSDLYSLGVVLYLMLTGRPPFEGKGPLDLLHKHRYAQFDPPQNIVPEIPHELNDLVCQLLEKDPDRRPADAAVVARMVQSIKVRSEQKYQRTEIYDASGHTVAEDTGAVPRGARAGPATLMSQLVRDELERQNRGGGLARFINHPAVLIVALLACVGILVYTFWPASAATLFQRGHNLMQTGSISDMEAAFSDYFDPLDERFPDHPYHDKVAEYRKQLEEARRRREDPALSVVEPLLRRAERLRQEGSVTEAKKIWENIVAVFADTPSEKRHVEQARAELKTLAADPRPNGRWQPVRDALKRAAELERNGKAHEAERIRQAIEHLYGKDPDAADILRVIRDARQVKKGP
jgi:serine/threonine-protein kinase